MNCAKPARRFAQTRAIFRHRTVSTCGGKRQDMTFPHVFKRCVNLAPPPVATDDHSLCSFETKIWEAVCEALRVSRQFVEHAPRTEQVFVGVDSGCQPPVAMSHERHCHSARHARGRDWFASGMMKFWLVLPGVGQ